MREWTVRLSSWSGNVDGGLALVAFDRAGQPGFADALLNEINRVAGFDHCTVFRFEQDHGDRFACDVVDAASRYQTPTARHTSTLYAERFARLDVNARYLGQGPSDAIRVTHLVADELPFAEYRDACYGRNGLVDRVSLIGCQDAHHTVALNFYRRRQRGLISRHERDLLLQCSPLLVRAAVRHADLMRPDDQRSAGAALLGRLSGAEQLTRREHELLALLLDGHTVAEAAAHMGVQPSTAITLKKRGFARLGVRSRQALLRRLAA